VTVDELKTLLALNGQQRIPYMESEIFVDKELYTFYLEHICSKYSWFFEDTISRTPTHLAFLYACEIIKDRWPSAEGIIIASPHTSYFYAEYVIKGRWPEAESVIATTAISAYWYADRVIKGRWPEGEAAIATDQHFGFIYDYYFGTNIRRDVFLKKLRSYFNKLAKFLHINI
jgi:hypothetical protein